MKNILLISDTHGYLDPALIKHINNSDEVWHAGDIGDISLVREIEKLKPVKAVYGNIDGPDVRAVYPEILNFECEGLKILMIHIGGYPGKYPSRIKELLLNRQPGLFICGHSHILKIIFDKSMNVLLINPGAAGRSGFHTKKTAVKFSIEDGVIKNAAVLELGKRTD